MGTYSIDIPTSWQKIEINRLTGLLMVIGESDTGKSTFARYLFRRLVESGRPAAFLDGDPGQSALEPPTTMSLVIGAREGAAQGAKTSAVHPPAGFVAQQDFPPIESCWRSFVGSISPHRHMLDMVIGAERLVRAARRAEVQTIVYDTCGLIDPAQGGVALKLAKIELLRPQALFGIQREQELEPLLIPLERSGKTEVIRLCPSREVRPRDRSTRVMYRTEGFARYFAGARPIQMAWNALAVFPWPQFSLHRLLAFEDREGYALGLGILIEIDRERRQFQALTPLTSLEGVKAIRLGSLVLDPKTYQGTML